MKNAFGSLTFEIIDTVVLFLVDPDDVELIRQRYRSASMKADSATGPTFYEIGSGALPGDKIASDFFRLVFQVAVVKWVRTTWQVQTAVKCPITQKEVDVSKSVFADDCYKLRIIEANRKKTLQIQEDQATHDGLLDKAIEGTGLKQNMTKQEIIFSFFGTDARKNERLTKGVDFTKKRVLDELKYLGMWMSSNGKIPRKYKPGLLWPG